MSLVWLECCCYQVPAVFITYKLWLSVFSLPDEGGDTPLSIDTHPTGQSPSLWSLVWHTCNGNILIRDVAALNYPKHSNISISSNVVMYSQLSGRRLDKFSLYSKSCSHYYPPSSLFSCWPLTSDLWPPAQLKLIYDWNERFPSSVSSEHTKEFLETLPDGSLQLEVTPSLTFVTVCSYQPSSSQDKSGRVLDTPLPLP